MTAPLRPQMDATRQKVAHLSGRVRTVRNGQIPNVLNRQVVRACVDLTAAPLGPTHRIHDVLYLLSVELMARLLCLYDEVLHTGGGLCTKGYPNRADALHL
eukprot:CAMPEP_0182555236 /NCGR_PEP_ID=MMETSP1323-20130603/50387_1 /TAXON_ID=236787 /ORGANISM="Florenciella parvula, Strain RCC1693" /LENGTH=100 /DNA_ID=CAMNT_0024766965 /DNA_START=505 /DNA_END=808 /DNA_ORIENTATION=-